METIKVNLTEDMNTENKNKEELKERWIGILREKASEYEHRARRNGEAVYSPSLDDVCNEIEAFFTGLNN